MTAFDTAWDLVKAFYLDPGGEAGWMTELSSGVPERASVSHRNHEVKRPPIAAKTFGDRYHMGVNLAHPMFKYNDFRVERKYDEERDRHYGKRHYGMEPMSEEQMMQEAIKTLLHEQGHGMIEPLLSQERSRAFFAGELGDYFSPTPLLQREVGAMLMEGIPFKDHKEVLRRRGYL